MFLSKHNLTDLSVPLIILMKHLFFPKHNLWRDSPIGDVCSLLYGWDPNSFLKKLKQWDRFYIHKDKEVKLFIVRLHCLSFRLTIKFFELVLFEVSFSSSFSLSNAPWKLVKLCQNPLPCSSVLCITGRSSSKVTAGDKLLWMWEGYQVRYCIWCWIDEASHQTNICQ